jgi:uncharacterized protein YndB with AHSA1/START domain
MYRKTRYLLIVTLLSRVALGSDAIVISANPDEIWSLLEDSTKLSQWMPPVRSTDGHRESLNAIRKCEVDFEGRTGQVVERCIVFEKPDRIGWLVVEDTLGFSKMLNDFAFDFVLDPAGPGKTRVVNTSYFEPRNWMASVMIALMIRRKFRLVRQKVLANIKRLVECGELHEIGIDPRYRR